MEEVKGDIIHFQDILDALKEEMSYERQVNLDDEAVKMRILTLLKDRDLNNHDIRQITGWNRKKVHQIIKELEPSGYQIRPVEFAPGFYRARSTTDRTS